jgi:hypothetical protein
VQLLTGNVRGLITYFVKCVRVHHVDLVLVGHGVAETHVGVVLHFVYTVQPPADNKKSYGATVISRARISMTSYFHPGIFSHV